MNAREFADTVIIAAANPWDGVRMADRQLAEALAELCPVLYVDPPSSPLSHLRRKGATGPNLRPRLRRLGPQLAHLTPVVAPGLARPGVGAVNVRLMARQVRTAIKALDGSAYALLESSVLAPIAGHCGEALIAYWAQDDFVGGAPILGTSATRAAHGEERLLRIADVIIAANPVVRDNAAGRSGKEVQMIPYGCDADHFAATADVIPAAGMRLPGPVAGFMGFLGDRIDVEMLLRVSAAGRSLLLVGSMHPRTNPAVMSELLARPNVQWVGGCDFEELPGWLTHMDVGLVPYNHSPFNEGSFPLKTLEYLAAGLPVVATDLPAIRWLDCADIAVADTPASFADAVETVLSQPSTAAGIARRRGFANQHTWRKRALAFGAALGVGTGIEAVHSRPGAGSPA